MRPVSLDGASIKCNLEGRYSRAIPSRRHRPTLECLERRLVLSGVGAADPGFGTNGQILLPVKPSGSNGLVDIYALDVRSNGKIDLAGISGFAESKTYSILQLNPNGEMDTTFGHGGTAEVSMPNGFYANDKLYAEQIESEGKIVITGTIQNLARSQMSIVARFNANGTPDLSFGTDGLVTLAIPGLALKFEAIQADGKIVLTGDTPTPYGAAGNTETVIIRLDANGQLDSSFGSNGLVTLDTVPAAERSSNVITEQATGVSIAPDGQIVLFGDVSIPQASNPTVPILTAEVFRLNQNGFRDLSLSQSGVQAANFAMSDYNGVIVQPDGKILLIGNAPPSYPNGPAVLARLNVNGTLEAEAPVPLPNSGYTLNAFTLQADGKIVITGDHFTNQLFVLRVNPDLTTDKSFGVSGQTRVTVPQDVMPGWVAAETVAITPTGDIVIAGPINAATSIVVAEFTGGSATVAASGPAPAPRLLEVKGDYLGQGSAEPTIYLPSVGGFAIRSQGSGDLIERFGLAGLGQTIPAPGDYDGSGKTELGVYLPSTGQYAYRPANGGPDMIESFGLAGAGQSIPAPGDYNGIGHDEMAIYLPSLGAFAIRDPGHADQIVPFGISGAGQTIPAPGDYFGTGKTDIAAYLPSIGAFAIRNPNGGADEIVPFGFAGIGQSIPVPGDYDGSGKTELAVYMPSLGEFAYRPANGGPDVIVPFGMKGTGQTIPVPGDYDGSGHDDIAAYLPSLGVFAYRPDTGNDVVMQFGLPGTNQTLPTPDVFALTDDPDLYPYQSINVGLVTINTVNKTKKG